MLGDAAAPVGMICTQSQPLPSSAFAQLSLILALSAVSVVEFLDPTWLGPSQPPNLVQTGKCCTPTEANLPIPYRIGSQIQFSCALMGIVAQSDMAYSMP